MNNEKETCEAQTVTTVTVSRKAKVHAVRTMAALDQEKTEQRIKKQGDDHYEINVTGLPEGSQEAFEAIRKFYEK